MDIPKNPSDFFLLQIMKLQLNRNINISLRLLERWSDDPLFMELYALYCMIKISFRDSRIRFKNQKDLLHKLGIGYSKFKNMTGHPMFDELFRMTDSTFVARRYRVNGVQLTLGCGKVNIPKNRILIKIKKNEITNHEKVLDRIREAMFVNLVRNNESVLNSGEPNSQAEVVDGSHSYYGLIDSTISNKTIALYLNVGLTKEKEIVSMAIQDKLVKRFENIKFITYVDNPRAYIEANEHNYPIGKLIPVYRHGAVFWQIANTWTLYKKGATNRWYFGEKDIEKEEKEKVSKKNDFNFFLKDNTHILNFLNAEEVVSEDGEILGIDRKKTKEEEARSLASIMAKEAHKNFWDGYEQSTQNQIVRKYYRAIIAEDKKRRMDMFLNRLKQSYDKVSGWSQEKIATVKSGMAEAEACCDEVGTSVAGVCGRISRRMKSYNNTVADKKADFNEVRDMYAEFAGDMAKAVGSVNEDICTYVKAEQFKEKIENMDITIRSLSNNNTTDNDTGLDGESIFKDIPFEELSFCNDTYLYPISHYSSFQ